MIPLGIKTRKNIGVKEQQRQNQQRQRQQRQKQQHNFNWKFVELSLKEHTANRFAFNVHRVTLMPLKVQAYVKDIRVTNKQCDPSELNFFFVIL